LGHSEEGPVRDTSDLSSPCVNDTFSGLISEGFLETLIYPDVLHELIKVRIA
jgi:hypothetical protein